MRSPAAAADPDFEVALALRADGAYVAVHGEVDIATAPDLEAMLDAALSRRPRTVVDLTDLRFIDASGIRVLARAARRAGDQDALVVVAAPLMARRVLEITGVDGLLRLVERATPVGDGHGPPAGDGTGRRN